MVSELRNMDGRFVGRSEITPRQSADTHLPGLAEVHDLCRDAFGAALVHLVTPDGEWGTPPEWVNWKMHTAAEMAPSVWPSARRVKPEPPPRIRKPRARR